MKKIFVVILLASAAFVNRASAQDSPEAASYSEGPGYKTALGVRLSSANAMQNNSVSFKQFITDRSAIEALFTFGDPLALGAMLELYKPLQAQGLSYFYGGGAYIGFVKKLNVNTQKESTNANFGAQGVIGLDYKFNNIPLNISLDWKPELNLVDDINFEPAAIGFTARFTFGK
ncbi:MAG TPA: hypothetical protein VMZ03_07610 [Chitinophagaceae bacterium]|nr:hypothetical protein [Chitinophagaceae bacterium]